MGTTKKADMMINNGTDYDKILFSTTAEQVEFTNTDGTKSNLQTKVNALSGRSSYVKTVGIDGGKVSNAGLRTSVGRFTVMMVGNAGGSSTIFLLIPLNTASASITTIGSVMTVTGVTSLGSQGGFTVSLIREGTDLYRLKIYGYPALLGSVVTFYAPEGVEIQYASQADS